LISSKWEEKEWKDFLDKKGSSNFNSCHSLQLMDSFEVTGLRARKHKVMVLEIMGADLFKVMKWYEYEGIPLPIVRIIAKQLLIGLHYLHEFCNCIHTDIKPENILIQP